MAAMKYAVASLILLGVLLSSACTSVTTPPSTPATPTETVEAAVTAAPETPVAAIAAPVDPAPLQAEPPATEPRRKVVVLDPGHGGEEVGAAAHGVVEKTSNLDFALRLEALLVAEGFDVVLTRRGDARAAAPVPGFTPTRSDLQARIDLANRARGDLFISIHSNGSTDASLRGVEAWFDSDRAYAAQGRLIADLMVRHVVQGLRGLGYPAVDRGLFDGRCFRQREGRCFTLFVIGGPRETTREEVIRRGGDPEALGFNGAERIYSVPANMPAALVELLFISNADDAAILRNEQARNRIARSLADAVLEYFALQDGS